MDILFRCPADLVASEDVIWRSDLKKTDMKLSLFQLGICWFI